MKEKVSLEDYFEFGQNKPIQRLAYSKEDVEYKVKIIKKMQDLNMDVKIDRLGNICGTLEGNGKSDKSILMGSHTDSVKDGGQYDGPVGVVSGLKVVEDVVEKVKNNELELDCNLKVVVWACEESNRFGKACLGSKWVEGTLQEKDLSIKEVLKKAEEEKRTLGEAISEYIENIKSYNIENIKYVDKVISVEEIMQAYETHIEQYQYLYENNIDVGIVSSITGPYRMEVEIEGKEKVKDAATLIVKLNEKAKEAEKEGRYRATVPVLNVKEQRESKTDFSIDVEILGESEHSGSTPMNRRKDAILAASNFILQLNEEIEREGYEFKVYFNEINTKNDSMNKVSGNAKINLGINANGLSEEIITKVLTNLIQDVSEKEGVKCNCKKVKKDIVNTKSKEEIANKVKIDVRTQYPTKSQEVFDEVANIIIGISHETGNNYYCQKTDKAQPVATSSNMINQIQKLCNENNITATVMPSWAGHDVAHIDIIEKMLLFIKSTGGSHNPNENTTKECIEKGIITLRASVIDNIQKVHQIVNKIEQIENSGIEEILSNSNEKTRKGKLRNILLTSMEAKEYGIDISKNLQNKLRKGIESTKKTIIEK